MDSLSFDVHVPGIRFRPFLPIMTIFFLHWANLVYDCSLLGGFLRQNVGIRLLAGRSDW